MSNLLQIFTEAIPISKYRSYHNIKRLSGAKKRLREIFQKLKSLPNAFAARHGYRVYIPFESNNSVVKSEIRKQVEQVLNDNGYEVLDYYKGLAIERGNKKRKVKIGKILSRLGEKDLLNKFSSDPVRNAASKNEKMLIVFSYHPYDIAGMSYDRDWTSCMDIDTGSNKGYVKCDIREGTFIAYLISVDDKNIVNPLARVLCKPYIARRTGEIVYYPSTVYGNAPFGFKTEVFNILNSIQDWDMTNTRGLKLVHTLYKDSDDINGEPDYVMDILDAMGTYDPMEEKLLIDGDSEFYIDEDFFFGKWAETLIPFNQVELPYDFHVCHYVSTLVLKNMGTVYFDMHYYSYNFCFDVIMENVKHIIIRCEHLDQPFRESLSIDNSAQVSLEVYTDSSIPEDFFDEGDVFHDILIDADEGVHSIPKTLNSINIYAGYIDLALNNDNFKISVKETVLITGSDIVSFRFPIKAQKVTFVSCDISDVNFMFSSNDTYNIGKLEFRNCVFDDFETKEEIIEFFSEKLSLDPKYINVT